MLKDKIEIYILDEVVNGIEGVVLKVLIKYNGKQYTYLHKGKENSKNDILEELLLTETKLKSDVYKKLFKGDLHKEKEKAELLKLQNIKRLFGEDYYKIIKECFNN